MSISAGKIALLGVGVVGGFGAKLANDMVSERHADRLKLLNRDVTKGTKDWESWSAAVEQEFPGRLVETPADHARFSAFLLRHPAPSWVRVEHEGYTRIRTKADDPLSSDVHYDRPGEKGFGFFAGAMTLLGAFALGAVGASQARSGASWTAFSASAAATAIGITAFGSAIPDIKHDDGMGRVRALQARVDAS